MNTILRSLDRAKVTESNIVARELSTAADPDAADLLQADLDRMRKFYKEGHVKSNVDLNIDVSDEEIARSYDNFMTVVPYYLEQFGFSATQTETYYKNGTAIATLLKHASGQSMTLEHRFQTKDESRYYATSVDKLRSSLLAYIEILGCRAIVRYRKDVN